MARRIGKVVGSDTRCSGDKGHPGCHDLGGGSLPACLRGFRFVFDGLLEGGAGGARHTGINITGQGRTGLRHRFLIEALVGNLIGHVIGGGDGIGAAGTVSRHQLEGERLSVGQPRLRVLSDAHTEVLVVDYVIERGRPAPSAQRVAVGIVPVARVAVGTGIGSVGRDGRAVLLYGADDHLGARIGQQGLFGQAEVVGHLRPVEVVIGGCPVFGPAQVIQEGCRQRGTPHGDTVDDKRQCKD